MALAASALLHPALCADAPSGRAPRTPPWHNPCGQTTILPRLRQPRHQQRQQQQQQQRQRQQQQQETTVAAPNASSNLGGRSWSLRNVRDKLQVARDSLRHDWGAIDHLYRGVDRFGNFANFSWLPRNHRRWYRHEVACLDRNSQASKVLPVLHEAFQTFSATFEELRKPNGTSYKRIEKREDLLYNIASQIKGVLCEVETSLIDRVLPRPVSLSESVVGGIHRGAISLTDSKIRDWIVIRAYGESIRDWIPILRQLGLAKKLPRGESATLRPCVADATKKPRPQRRKGKNEGRNGAPKDKPRYYLRPGQPRRRHSRRRHQRRRVSTTTTSPPLCVSGCL